MYNPDPVERLTLKFLIVKESLLYTVTTVVDSTFTRKCGMVLALGPDWAKPLKCYKKQYSIIIKKIFFTAEIHDIQLTGSSCKTIKVQI